MPLGDGTLSELLFQAYTMRQQQQKERDQSAAQLERLQQQQAETLLSQPRPTVVGNGTAPKGTLGLTSTAIPLDFSWPGLKPEIKPGVDQDVPRGKLTLHPILENKPRKIKFDD